MARLIDVDNSTLVPVAECSTSAALKALGYEGKGDRDAMDAGSTIHDGLEAHYSGKSREESIKAFEESYEAYFPTDVRTVEEDRLSILNLRDHFTTHIDRHPIDSQPFEVLEAEVILGMPLDDAGEIGFWIKRDLKIREKNSGFIMPLDHKTTGRVTSYWQKNWRLASQLIGYTWATGKETGEMCPGAYVNAIELNMLPNSNRRCAAHKMKYSECRLEHTKTVLLIYECIKPVIDNWRSSAIMLSRKLINIKKHYPTLEMIQYAPMEGSFNRSCGFCSFNKYCRAGKLPHLADQFLVHKTWAPWNKPEAKFIDWRK